MWVVINNCNCTIFWGWCCLRTSAIEINEINWGWMAVNFWLTELPLLCIWVIVIIDSLLGVPRSSEQQILLISFGFFVGLIDISPVNDWGNKFFLLVFLFLRLTKFLHFGAVFNVEAVNSSSLVTNEKLSVTWVHAHAGDICRCGVAENTLQSSVGGVPNFNGARMSCDKGVEHRVVKHAYARVLVSKVVIGWFVIFVVLHAATAKNDSLGRLCHSKAVDFVQWAVNCLDSVVGTSVPNSHHSWDVARNDLLGSWHPFDSNQTVVMAL